MCLVWNRVLNLVYYKITIASFPATPFKIKYGSNFSAWRRWFQNEAQVPGLFTSKNALQSNRSTIIECWKHISVCKTSATGSRHLHIGIFLFIHGGVAEYLHSPKLQIHHNLFQRLIVIGWIQNGRVQSDAPTIKSSLLNLYQNKEIIYSYSSYFVALW